MASFLDKLQSMQDVNKGKSAEQEKYDDLVRANKVIGVAGLAAPPAVGMGLQALTDMQIEQMEKKNPSLAPSNPFSPQARGRFSTVGQVLMGYGYPTQRGIPATTIGQRLANVFGGNEGMPDPRTNMFNARGNVFNILGGGNQVQPTVGTGYETSGGGGADNPSQGTTNFGGRESMVSDNDYSGYA